MKTTTACLRSIFFLFFFSCSFYIASAQCPFPNGIEIDTTICEGDNVVLNALIGASVTVMLDTDIFCPTCPPVIVQPDTNAYYSFRINYGICSSLVNITINVEPRKADFDFTIPDCLHDPVQFTDHSKGNVTRWFWDFGDGAISNEKNAQHVYTSGGTKQVSLVIETEKGCRDTISKTVSLPVERRDFTWNTSFCLSHPVQFVDLSKKDVTKWFWDFGDGSTSNEQHPLHVYTNNDPKQVTLVVETEKGCLYTISKTVDNLPPELRIDSIHVDTPACGTSGWSLRVFASGGESPEIDYYLLDGEIFSETGEFTDIYAGAHIITAWSIGCKADKIINLEKPGALKILTINKTDIRCTGEANGSIQVEAAGGRPPYIYHLHERSNTSGFFDQLAHGYSTLSVIDSNGCTALLNFLITDPYPLTFSTTQTNPRCYGSADGNIAVYPSGGTAPYKYRLNGGPTQTDGNFNGLTAGIYHITVLDVTNCSYEKTVTLTQPACIEISLEARGTSCGNSNGYIKITSSNEYPPYGYSIDEEPYLASNAFNNLASGLHQISVIDSRGCIRDTSVVLQDYPAPIAVVSNDTTIYGGESVQLHASGGKSYRWIPSDGLSNSSISDPIATPSQTTTYQVIVTDSSCSETDADTGFVTVYVVCAVPEAFCAGSTPYSITFAWHPIAGASEYLVMLENVDSSEWQHSRGDTTYTIEFRKPCATASIRLKTLFDGYDCPGDFSPPVTCHAGSYVSVIPEDTTICQGGSVQLEATVDLMAGNSTYHWMPAEGLSDTTIANPVASPERTTVYYVRVESQQDCSATDSVVIRVAEPVAPEVYCAGSTPSKVTFSWHSVVSASEYLVNVNNGGWQSVGFDTAYTHTGMRLSETASIQVKTLFDGLDCAGNTSSVISCTSDSVCTLTVSADPARDAICQGDNVQLNVSVAESGNYTYSWTPSEGLNNPSIANPVASPASTLTYTVTVTSDQDCSGTDLVTVSVTKLSQADWKAKTTDLTVKFSSPKGGETSWLWNFGDGSPESTLKNPVHTYPSYGSYFVTLHTANQCNADSAQFELILTGPQNITAGVTDFSASSFTVSPNPFRNEIILTADMYEAAQVQLSVTDVLGKLLRYENVHALAGILEHRITLTDEAPGLYYLTIRVNDRVQTFKLSKIQ